MRGLLSLTTYTFEGFVGQGLQFVLNGFNLIYCAVALFMWIMAALFSLEYMKNYKGRKKYYIFLFLTLFATLGVFLSKDLFTLYVFFEIMSFTSYVWVAFDEKKESLSAARTYLAVAVIGGMVMLMGIFMLYHMCHTLAFDELALRAEEIMREGGALAKQLEIACYLLFIGFGAKAGAFPMHIWLPKAHPAAPAPASALLSGILTKSGIFGILIITCYLLKDQVSFSGFLLIVGVLTMLLGGLLGILSVNIKRTLACSSVSQIGFILTGIAMMGFLGSQDAIAARGTFLHMLNHSLFKLVLFMAAGVVYMNTHKLDLDEIKGFGRNKPLLHVIFLCGALGIGGIPGFSGYISKTLLHESILEGVSAYPDLKMVETLFLIAGGMTVCYMMKLYIAVFIQKNQDEKLQSKYDAMAKTYMNPLSKMVLTISALSLPVMGMTSDTTMNKLSDMAVSFMKSEPVLEEIHYFSLTNLKGGLISIALGVAFYICIVRLILMRRNGTYRNVLPAVFDLEKLVYVPVIEIVTHALKTICRIMDLFVDKTVVFFRKTIYKDNPLPHELLEGNMFTHLTGEFLEDLQKLWNKTIRRKNPTKINFEHKIASVYEWFRQSGDVIARTMSFGLLIFLGGLIVTMCYLLYVNQMR